MDILSPHQEYFLMATDPEKIKYRKAFVERFKKYRELAYDTPREFSEAVGISIDSCISYEKRSLPPHHLLVPVADKLKIDVYELLTGEPPQAPRPLPEDGVDIARRWLALPEALQDQVKDFMTSIEVLVNVCPALKTPAVSSAYKSKMDHQKILEADYIKRVNHDNNKKQRQKHPKKPVKG